MTPVQFSANSLTSKNVLRPKKLQQQIESSGVTLELHGANSSRVETAEKIVKQNRGGKKLARFVDLDGNSPEARQRKVQNRLKEKLAARTEIPPVSHSSSPPPEERSVSSSEAKPLTKTQKRNKARRENAKEKKMTQADQSPGQKLSLEA